MARIPTEKSNNQERCMKFSNKQSIGAKLLRKVPEITAYFWIIKILTTGMGEAASDFFVQRFNPILAVVITGILLLASLFIQFSARRYSTWTYWLAVTLVAVFGTMAADVLHKGLGIPYLYSTIFFAITLAMIFSIWHVTEKTLSIHSINNFRREFFYWATVLTTFALGTAAGDMTASTLHLGYFNSGILFLIIIAIPIITYWLLRFNEVFTFWFAYIVTRPLGASFADWMGKSHKLGGLGWGDGYVALGLTILILGFVGYMAITKKDSTS